MTKTDSPDGGGPNRSMAKSCHGPLGNGVDLIGSWFAGLLTSWQPWQVLQNFSVSLSIPGHQTFDRNLCFILTIPGCPSWARLSTRGLNLLGMTILVPRRINLPVTHSSLHTGMYRLCRSPFQFPSLMCWRSSTNSLNLVPRVSHLTAPWGERKETLVWSGHVCPRIWDITIKLLKGGAP